MIVVLVRNLPREMEVLKVAAYALKLGIRYLVCFS